MKRVDLNYAHRNQYRLKLIKLVKEHPVIWLKTKHKKHSNVDLERRKIKEQTWIKIAKKIGASSDKVRRSWENLRDQYRRDLKRQISLGVEPRWHFFNDMNFIRSVVRVRMEKSNDSENESAAGTSLSEEESNPMEISNPSYSKKNDTAPNNETYKNDHLTRVLLNSAPLQISNQIQQCMVANASTSYVLQTGNNAPTVHDNVIKIESNLNAYKPHENIYPQQQKQFANNIIMTSVLVDKVIKTENDADNIMVACDKNDTSRLLQKSPENYTVMSSVADTNTQTIKIESDSESDSKDDIPLIHNASLGVGVNIEEITLPIGQLVQNSTTSLIVDKNSGNTESPEEINSLSESKITTSNSLPVHSIDLSSELSPKRPRLIEAANELEIQDADYHFVISLLPSLRSIASSRKFGLRMQIMTLINNVLESKL